MSLKKIKLYSDIVFYGSMIFAIGILIKNWYDGRNLPDGVCPITNNYDLIRLGIVFLILSFIVSLVVERKIKKANVEESIDAGENNTTD